jgi:SAM-dependent methyltransferase
LNSSCLSCGENKLDGVRPYRTKLSYGRTVFGGAQLKRCVECGLVQVVPRPDPRVLADYYARDYRSGPRFGADVADASRFPRDNLFYFNRGQSIARLVSPFLKKEAPQILDVGAGYGHVLYGFGELYPRGTRSAVEFSDVCAEHLKSVGVQVHTRPVEEVLPGLERKFDLVILSHVLEHLLEPGAALRLIRASLVPGGVLYIEVPNIPPESLLRYADHRWAPRFDEPHISFFSVPTLRRLMHSAGFEELFCETAGPEYRYISRLRFHLPPLRSTLQDLLPASLFFFLRRLRLTRPLRVQDREESFYQYGGFRLWIRSVWKNPSP